MTSPFTTAAMPLTTSSAARRCREVAPRSAVRSVMRRIMVGGRPTAERPRGGSSCFQGLQKAQNLRELGSGLGGRQAWKPVSDQKEIAPARQHEPVSPRLHLGDAPRGGGTADPLQSEQMERLRGKGAEAVAPGRRRAPPTRRRREPRPAGGGPRCGVSPRGDTRPEGMPRNG